MQSRPQAPGPGAGKVSDIAKAVRGLCAVLNTARVYDTRHPVFQRAVQQQVALFDAALKGLRELPLVFVEGQIRYGTTPLDPGSGVFQKTAEQIEGRGIKSIVVYPGVTPAEVQKFAVILTSRSDRVESKGLAECLRQEGIAHIREQQVKVNIGEQEGGAPAPPAVPAPGPARTPGAPRAAGSTWDIETGLEDASPEEILQSFEQGVADRMDRQKPIHNFVQGVLDALTRKEATRAQAAEILSQEFANRLNEEVEQVRKESEAKIQRLERVKDVMLRELDNLRVAAIVLDLELNVIAMNETARKIVGEITSIPRSSSLGQFINSKLEKQMVDIGGGSHLAHIIISTEPEAYEGMMLICLE